MLSLAVRGAPQHQTRVAMLVRSEPAQRERGGSREPNQSLRESCCPLYSIPWC